jgi:hypothetical protein
LAAGLLFAKNISLGIEAAAIWFPGSGSKLSSNGKAKVR